MFSLTERIAAAIVNNPNAIVRVIEPNAALPRVGSTNAIAIISPHVGSEPVVFFSEFTKQPQDYKTHAIFLVLCSVFELLVSCIIVDLLISSLGLEMKFSAYVMPLLCLK
jgi:hypothetical protein